VRCCRTAPTRSRTAPRSPTRSSGARATDVIDAKKIASGEAGNDELHGKNLEGGRGNDELHGEGTGVNLRGEEGNDRISGSPGVLFGGPGNDTISTSNSEGRATAYGGAGNDKRIATGSARSKLVGGDGRDELVDATTSAPTDAKGGDGVDTLVLDRRRASDITTALLDDRANDGKTGQRSNYHSDIENVRGSVGRDIIGGTAGPNRIDGNHGPDTINGRGGRDVLIGGPDTLVIPETTQCFEPFERQLYVCGNVASDCHWEGCDLYRDEHGILLDVDTLDGGADGDAIKGGFEKDTVTYASRTKPVRVTVGAGTNDGERGERDFVAGDIERLVGGRGNDRLTGGLGAEEILGMRGDDTLLGGGGEDRLVGGPGKDRFDGGAGIDTASWEGSTAAIRVTLDGNAADGARGEGDNVLATVENLIGGNGNDELYGSAAANTLTGGPGNDRLGGSPAAAAVASQAPGQLIKIPGGDTLVGNAGDDILVGSNHSDIADGGDGNDLIETGPADDEITSGAGNDTIDGGDGNDKVDAGAGNDTVAGGAGDDDIDGGGGGDELIGGGGNDLLIGGAGVDKLRGDGGADRLDARDSAPGDTSDCGPDTDRYAGDDGDTFSFCEDPL